MRMERVCILGGSGFIGRNLANRLLEHNIAARVATRRRERSRHLLIIPRLELIEADVYNEDALTRLLAGADAVINLVGILNEKGSDGSGFRRAHVELTEIVLRACARAGIRRYVHMGALGADADNGPSHYQRTKGEAERLVLSAQSPELDVTVFRPSVVFGPEDSFFNRFAGLLRIAPGAFPLPTPYARFQPVFVGDVAEAFVRSLTNETTFGKSLDLVGPQRYTLLELVRYVATVAGLRRKIIPCPDWMSRLQARVMGMVPTKPFSMDNYLSATVDNISDHNALPALGIHPTAVEAVVPGYLSGGGRGHRGDYDGYRRLARR
ncbi:NADH dehydrogenase [Natronocella acetinitrilica]|uniref:NADH dehydrogenase n=1 Tax=Natronocella acetinitrilica TaxID=414046 RepID=A0AAE3KA78_9GAMM|nr:complex I NDUFA9 subunit family protein [Natronocella acetinitrilica]MCP1673189.1 NADH dehydrogenase [Natronocella acetinitrilica]